MDARYIPARHLLVVGVCRRLADWAASRAVCSECSAKGIRSTRYSRGSALRAPPADRAEQAPDQCKHASA
jgi:hypothetical protein